MQILGPGPAAKLPPDAGMTLIELLVVVAVLAVLSVGVTLTVGTSDRDSIARDETRFIDSWKLQADFARNSRTPHGLAFDGVAMQPMRLGSRGWQAVGSSVEWDGRVVLATDRQTSFSNAPDLVLLPSGQSTAFSVTFSDGPSDIPRQCRGGGWEAVTCD